MLTPSAWRISSQMAGTVGTSIVVATFSTIHWKAMGGYWQKIHQIVPDPNDDPPFMGDCFEVVVPKSYLLNKSDEDHADEVAIFARAFFTAPCFTLEQRLIQLVLLSTKESETTPIEKEQFPIGSQQSAWQVIARQPHQFIQMEWGSKSSIGGITNFATGPGPSPDLRTLRFGSTISGDKLHPTMLWFHEQYSKLLLAQTANRLKVQASGASSSSST